MLASWRLGKPFGIGLYVHWTFWLLPLWITFTHDPAGPLSLGMQLGLVLALFACVALHELGHALAARGFGIGTVQITLSPIGGLALLQRSAWKPLEEFCIAVAGPLVNVAIAALLGGVLLAGSCVWGGFPDTTVGTFLVLLLVMNVFMVLFNMLPAFPMDGGRVLRSFLGGLIGMVPATRIAAGVGVVTALLFGFVLPWLGIPFFQSPLLPFIALFVMYMGMQELRGLAARERAARSVVESLPVPRWTPLTEPVKVLLWDPLRQCWVEQARPQGMA